MTPPTGTVTFLFTDIESSTRLWEEQPEQMQTALARHDALLRETIESHGGYVFKTIGDAFCAAFATAPEALTASLHVQRALAREEALVALHVRMALHTGTAEQRDEDYFGPPLNRVARLLSAAHGGQVLLSGATQELVRDSLPSGTGLRDLGEHRLKDLTRPEHIFQLAAPDLPGDFPPLRTLDLRLHNLPVQPTPFIGREKEIREITERLQQPALRLLTLTGPGGTGKTRLSLQVAAELVEAFTDGAYFVNLAPVTDPALVPFALAQALGVKEAAERPLVQTLQEQLRDQRLLLVLDNFEQVTAAAPLIGQLLSAAPGVKVLVTSRVPLHLQGEHEHPIPPLSLPDPRRLPSLERLTQYEAVRLFIERARAVRPDFEVTSENAPAVAEICHRLDGLPLAIELAAARIRVLPPQAMLSRLQSRLKLLTGGSRDLPARQQTLRNAITWSHDLLEEGERVLFRRLAVFAGATLAAIEQVCDAEGDLALEVLDGVASLVEKSLLRQAEGVAGEPRFVMLETIREYATEKLEESTEAEEIWRRHGDFFLALAAEAEPRLTGAGTGRWPARLEEEHDNFRLVLRRSWERGDVERTARLAQLLWRFWDRHGHYGEGRRWLADVLSAEGLSPHTRAAALYGAGVLASQQRDYDAARRLYEQGLALARELADARGAARLLNGLGIVAVQQGEPARAEALYEEAATHFRELGDRRGTAAVLNNLGAIATEGREYARAESLYQEALALTRGGEDLALAGVALLNLGQIAYRQGDLHRARTLLQESLQLSLESGFVHYTTYSLAYLAEVATAAGEAERAARLFGAVEARFAALGTHVDAVDRDRYDHALAAARALLDEAAWRRAWEAGEAMTLDEAIACALEEWS